MHTAYNFFNSRNDDTHRISQKFEYYNRKNETIDEYAKLNTSKSSNFKAKGFIQRQF